MIPLTLVTGFLGSGKTTLLEHLAMRHRDRRVVWLVNEFSARDMDTARLSGKAADVVGIAGGSIFCRCKATEFLGVLRGLPERFSPEAVVIEASGMADPLVAGKVLVESGLDRVYEMGAVVAVVDPGSFLKLLHTLPNIRTQIEAATLVAVNKIDLYPASDIERAEAAIRAINPAARITRTRYAAIDADLFATPGVHMTWRGEWAPCVDPNFVKFEIPLTGELDLDWLREGVETLCGEIYRLKGVTWSGGRCYRLDYSASGWQCMEVADELSPALVLIARGAGEEPARELVRRIAAKCGGRGMETPAVDAGFELK